MKKLTKLLSIFVMASVAGTGVATVAACNSEDNTHQHTYTYTDNEDGKTHTTKCKDGDYEISESHVDGNDDKKCDNCGGTITVQGGEVVEDAVTKVEISGDKEVAVKGKLTLTATVTATGNAATTVTWSSSDPNTATVTATGEVTGVAEGTVTITATSTHDNTKKADYIITVVAEAKILTYDELVAQSNKLYNNDFEEEEAGNLPEYSGLLGGTLGVYSYNSNSNYDTHYVKVENGKVVQVSPSGAMTHTMIDFGAISSKQPIEGYMDLTLTDASNSQTFFKFVNASGSEVFGLRTDSDCVKYRLNGGDTVATTPAITTVTSNQVYFRFNPSTKKLTVAINGEYLVKNFDTEFAAIAGIQLSSGNGNTKTVTLDNLVICGTELTLAESKLDANEAIDAELAKYDKTEYTINGGDLDAAVAAAKQAVTDAEDFEGVNQAVADCKAALKAVVKDSAIAEARTKALNDLKIKYPATKFTTTGLEGDDAKYNNVSLYTDKIAEVEGALANKNSSAEINELIGAADTYLADITDAAMLNKKIAEASASLDTYAVDYKANNCDGDADKQAAVDKALPNQKTILASSSDIADVNAKLTEAKAAIVKAVSQVGADPSEVIAAAVTDITNYKSTEITAIETNYAAYVTLINAAKDVATNSETGTLNALTATDIDQADVIVAGVKAEVDRYLANYTAHKAADDYKTAEAAKVKNNAVKDKILDLTFLDTFKEVKKTEDKTATEVRAAATAAANKQVNDLVASLATLKIAVSVGNGETCYVTYGTKLTLSDLHVSGFNVSAATLGGKAVPETASDDEDLTVYNPVTVTVTGKTPIDGFKAKESLNLEAVSEITYLPTTIVDNNLFTASADLSSLNKQAFKVSAGLVNVGTENKFEKVTIGTDYTTVVSLQNISKGASNKTYPLTITVNSSLSSLSAKIICADTKGGTKRAGKIHIEVNGEEVLLVNDVIWGASADDKLTNLKMGDIVTIWIENASNSSGGGHFYIADISAEVDGSKIEKTVNVTWKSAGESGADLTESYHYYDTITAPTAPAGGEGQKFDGWYNGTTKLTDTLAGGNYTFEAKYLDPNVIVKYTVDSETKTVKYYLEGDATITLADPEVDGKVFLHWSATDDDKEFDFSSIKAGTSETPNVINLHAVFRTTVNVESVTVGGANAVEVGKEITLTATVNPTNADSTTVTWAITEGDAATIDASSGKVIGVKVGTVKVTATAGGVTSDPYPITVNASNTITFDASTITSSTDVSGEADLGNGFFVAAGGGVTAGDGKLTLDGTVGVNSKKARRAIGINLAAGTYTIKVTFSCASDRAVSVGYVNSSDKWAELAKTTESFKGNNLSCTLTVTLDSAMNIYIGADNSKFDVLKIEIDPVASTAE